MEIFSFKIINRSFDVVISAPTYEDACDLLNSYIEEYELDWSF